MSSPKPNATPAEMAALYKLNKRLYGTKPEIGPGKSMAGGNVGTAITSTATTPMPPKRPPPLPPTPRRPDPLPPMPKRSTPLPAQPKSPDPVPTRPTRPDLPVKEVEPKRPMPLPQPVKPLPPVEPKRPTPMPAPLRPTGKPSNQMEYKKGGSVPSASKRGDGIAQRGKTRGKMC